jgi:hypothetical protein
MTAFWTTPTATTPFWLTNSLALFWTNAIVLTLSEIGSTTGSFSESSGIYTVSGTGSGVAGTSDSLIFVSQLVSGNIEIIANVTTQTGTNAYAIAGLMIRDSQTAVDGQCALVSVSPQNGVNFSFRTADGATATTTLGPSIATPIWLRLVVSQTSVAGYQSSDGTDWELVGVCTMTLPADYYSGFAVSSNATPSNTATFENVNFLAGIPQRSANLLSWLRADVGVTYDSSSSNEVSQWADQSANGYNGSQATSSNQPTIAFNAVSGLPAIVFSGSEFLQLPSGLADFTSGCSIFLVLNPTALTTNGTVLDLGNGALGNNLSIKESNTSGGAEFLALNGTTSSNLNSSSAVTVGVFQLLEVIYDGISDAELFVNGTSLASSTTMQASIDITRADNFIGQSGSGGNYFQGSIAEMLLYNTALTAIPRQSVEQYLMYKYDI